MRTCECQPLEGRRLFSAADIVLPSPEFLEPTDVQAILAQAASRARPGQVAAVVDREGAVLGVIARAGGNASETATIADLAVQRARTAAAFQSAQNAFTTRTARFIIQNHFPEPVRQTPGGPLYGVQFSSFPGSDVLLPELIGNTGAISADPGGVPLYVNGVAVGGIGVAGDGRDVSPNEELKETLIDLRGDYGERSIRRVFRGNEERDFDEAVAIAGAKGYAAPKAIRATRVFIDGLRFPFTRSGAAGRGPGQTFDQITNAGAAALVAVPAAGKADPAIIAGTPRLTNGEVAGVTGLYRNRGAAGATAPQEAARTPINETLSSTDASLGDVGDPDSTAAVTLSAADVETIISNAVQQSFITRAGIREPDGVRAQVHVVVVDRDGDVLSIFRMADATNFSYDVAVQKARTAAFFSDDTHAISTRALGFVSQKFFPIGIDGGVRGPLFTLQDKVNIVRNGDGTLTPNLPNLADTALPNGITIFPGGLPLYKNGVLVGGIGISGDGVDQDDLIAFGGTAGFRPPNNIRSDQLDDTQLTNLFTARATQLAIDAGLSVGPAPANDPDALRRFDPDTARQRLAAGLPRLQLPYVKFPRNFEES